MIVKEDLIKEIKGKIYIGGSIIGEVEMRQLIAEAKALEGFRLWNIINETIKDDALQRGWNKSTSMNDLNAGKTIYYVLDLQNSIIRLLLKDRNMV